MLRNGRQQANVVRQFLGGWVPAGADEVNAGLGVFFCQLGHRFPVEPVVDGANVAENRLVRRLLRQARVGLRQAQAVEHGTQLGLVRRQVVREGGRRSHDPAHVLRQTGLGLPHPAPGSSLEEVRQVIHHVEHDVQAAITAGQLERQGARLGEDDPRIGCDKVLNGLQHRAPELLVQGTTPFQGFDGCHAATQVVEPLLPRPRWAEIGPRIAHRSHKAADIRQARQSRRSGLDPQDLGVMAPMKPLHEVMRSLGEAAQRDGGDVDKPHQVLKAPTRRLSLSGLKTSRNKTRTRVFRGPCPWSTGQKIVLQNAQHALSRHTVTVR